jgi:hypothetical protein
VNKWKRGEVQNLENASGPPGIGNNKICEKHSFLSWLAVHNRGGTEIGVSHINEHD